MVDELPLTALVLSWLLFQTLNNSTHNWRSSSTELSFSPSESIWTSPYTVTDTERRYQRLLGCNNIDLTNTTSYYARYTTSVICNAIIQNSVRLCSLSGLATRPLCAESCVLFSPTNTFIPLLIMRRLSKLLVRRPLR